MLECKQLPHLDRHGFAVSHCKCNVRYNAVTFEAHALKVFTTTCHAHISTRLCKGPIHEDSLHCTYIIPSVPTGSHSGAC